MGKKKKQGKGGSGKKTRNLTPLELEIAGICHISTANIQMFKAGLLAFKQQYKKITGILNLPDGPASDPDPQTSKGKEFLSKMLKEQDFYQGLMVSLVLGNWLSNKKFFKITKELLEFVENDFWMQDWSIRCTPLIRSACFTPVYLDFSETGSSIPNTICSCISIIPPESGEEYGSYGQNDVRVAMLTLNPPYVMDCIAYQDPTAKELFTGLEKADNQNSFTTKRETILKILIYIGYLMNMADENGEYLVNKSIQNGTLIQVLPTERPNDLPISGMSPEWAVPGLRMLMGYLKRENMLKEFRGLISQCEGVIPDIIPATDDRGKHITLAFYHSIVEWEENRVIYSFDNSLKKKLVDMYADGLFESGFLHGLVEYVPHRTIALSDGPYSFLARACVIEGEKKPGIVLIDICTSEEIRIVVGTEPLQDKLSQYPKYLADETIAFLCALKHILTVTRQKNLKRLASEPVNKVANKGTPPSLPTPTATQIPTVHTGYSVGTEPSLQLFELSESGVKKVSNRDLVRRHGWQMSPHMRRRHPHRYWVGSGDNKHLEVRWIDEIRVNGKREKDGATTTVIHQLVS